MVFCIAHFLGAVYSLELVWAFGDMALGLMTLPNVVMTPHTGSATYEARDKMAIMAAENLIAALKGERPEHLVNPEVLE